MKNHSSLYVRVRRICVAFLTGKTGIDMAEVHRLIESRAKGCKKKHPLAKRKYAREYAREDVCIMFHRVSADLFTQGFNTTLLHPIRGYLSNLAAL